MGKSIGVGDKLYDRIQKITKEAGSKMKVVELL